MKRDVVALIPMRHHSERVPGKNYRSFAGKPLYYYIIESLQSCPLIKEIVVDTDSQVIKERISAVFPKIHLIDRPDHLKAGTVPMNDVLLYDIDQVDADFYLQTHSTNPLLSAKTITNAVQNFLENYPLYDTLFSVTRLQTRLWDELARPINHNPSILLRTQDLPPVYEENSCIYIFTHKTLEERHNRIGERPLIFEIDRTEAVDIDEELDFKVAEFLYQDRQKAALGEKS